MTKKRKVFKWSKIVSIVEQLVYIAPTLSTVLYYYFSQIEQTISRSSKYSFGLAVALFVLFLIYRGVMHRTIAEFRQGVVQTETDLKNGVGDATKVADNAIKGRRKLDLYDRGGILISLIIFALAVRILEQALIGLTMLAYIACGSVCAGYGIHLGVLSLRKKEAIEESKI